VAPAGKVSHRYIVHKFIVSLNAVMSFVAGKDDIFGGDLNDLECSGKSFYFVRALSYCDINKIELHVLKETLTSYPEFEKEFMDKIQVTFNLKRVCYLYNIL
jgi:hypothetical protein